MSYYVSQYALSLSGNCIHNHSHKMVTSGRKCPLLAGLHWVTGSPQVVDLFQSSPSFPPELSLFVLLVLLGFVAMRSFQSYGFRKKVHLAYLETGLILALPLTNCDTAKGLDVSEFQRSPLKWGKYSLQCVPWKSSVKIRCASLRGSTAWILI